MFCDQEAKGPSKRLEASEKEGAEAHPSKLQLAGMREGPEEGRMADEEHEEAGGHALDQRSPEGGHGRGRGWRQPRQVISPAQPRPPESVLHRKTHALSMQTVLRSLQHRPMASCQACRTALPPEEVVHYYHSYQH